MLTGNFTIDMNEFDKLSRHVGYYSCLSNQKDENDNYDLEMIQLYEELRDRQLEMLENILNTYTK
jgi:hypothetical protein